MRCFEDSADFVKQDQLPFKFRHRLVNHPALTLENLTRVIPALKEDQVYFSQKKMTQTESFEQAITENRKGAKIEDVIEGLRKSSSYIMLRGPESHPSLQPVYRDLLADVEETIRAQKLGDRAIDPLLYLFISAPNSITPFHFDRQSNFLMQIRGSKVVTVFPPWDERVITPAEYEHHMSRKELAAVKWKPEAESLGTPFKFTPGEALHIPFAAGHHVVNGSEDLSISLSIFFNHTQTELRRAALLANRRLRPVLEKVGLSPRPVGASLRHDTAKSHVYSVASKVARRLRRA